MRFWGGLSVWVVLKWVPLWASIAPLSSPPPLALDELDACVRNYASLRNQSLGKLPALVYQIDRKFFRLSQRPTYLQSNLDLIRRQMEIMPPPYIGHMVQNALEVCREESAAYALYSKRLFRFYICFVVTVVFALFYAGVARYLLPRSGPQDQEIKKIS